MYVDSLITIKLMMHSSASLGGKQDRKNEGYFLGGCRPGTDLVDGGRTRLMGESFLSPMLSDTEHGGCKKSQHSPLKCCKDNLA